MESKRFYRTAEFQRETIEQESRKVELAFSSEFPVERYFGREVLDHEKADLSFLNSGRAPLLLDHETKNQIGVIESALIGKDRVGRATVRFGKSARAEEIFQDVIDGIRLNVSVGYDILDMAREEREEEGSLSTFRVAFRPLEISIVSIPADETVGVGRKNNENKVEVKMTEVKEKPQVDVESITKDVREKEVHRIREIEALGDKHDQRDAATEAIRQGMSVPEFKGVLLERIASQPIKLPSEVDMSPKEQQEYSLLRAINASITGNWSKAGFERELSQEIEQKCKRSPRGFYVPTNIQWGQRDLTVGTATAGGNLVGTDHRGDLFIDALREELLVADLGATILTGLEGDLQIPRLNARTTVAFMTAEFTAVTEGAPTFNQITLQPKTVAGWVDISRKLQLQSNPAVEQIIRNDITRQIAAKIDDVAIEGGGSGEPSGILQGTDVAVVSLDTNGAAPTYGSTIDLIKEVAVDNALRGALAYATTPQAVAKMRQTVRVSSTDSRMIMDGPDSLNGYQVKQSALVPSDLTKGTGTNLSALIFGNWNDVILGFYSGLDVVVDTSTFSNVGGLRLNFFQDLDVALRHDESFAVIKDMVTT